MVTQYIGLSGETLDSIKEIMLEKDPLDFNDSGIADAQDVIILVQALLTDSKDVKFDVNTDGRVDIIDLVEMKKYLAGIYVRK